MGRVELSWYSERLKCMKFWVSLLFSCLPLLFIFEAVVVGLLLEICDIYVCPGFISVSVIKYPDTKQFMGDRFFSAYSSRLQSILAIMSRQELDAANTSPEYKEMYACLSFLSSLYVVQVLSA